MVVYGQNLHDHRFEYTSAIVLALPPGMKLFHRENGR